MSAGKDYHELTAREAVHGLREGRIDLREYVEALIARTASYAHLNTYVSHDPQRIRAVVREGTGLGPLFGLPFAVKDIIDSVDYPTAAATPALREWHPRSNAPVLQSLLDAGGTLMGKQAPGELSFGFSGNNPAYGTVGNPYDRSMFSGGSSGGTASGVTAGLVPVALGADTGGSCRMPAALCGCVGFRPTLGRYSQAGVIPVSTTRDTVGPLARNVGDVRLVDAVCTDGPTTAESRVSFAGLRIGVPRGRFYDDLDPEVERLTDEALARMTDAGATIVERDIERIDELNEAVSFTVVLYEVLRELSAYLYQRGARFTVRDVVEQVAGPFEREMLASVLDKDAVTAEQYRQAIRVHRPRLQAAYARYFEENRVAVIVVPTTPLPARPHVTAGDDRTVELNGQQVDTFFTYIRNCDPSSNAGLPCLSVPSGMSRDGLPVGIEVVGPSASDALVLDVGEALERITEPLPMPTA